MQTTTRTTTRPNILSASTIIGDSVRNLHGDDLGKIEEVMLDLEHGRIAYAVLSFGGFLGMGNKLFAIPWEALVLDSEDHEFILDVEKDVLKDAPGFDKNDWPEMSYDWGATIYEHYGYSPYWD